MPVLFQSRPGVVVRLDDPAVQCSTRLLGLNPPIGFREQKSIVTRVTVAQQINAQFLHTLGDHVFIYVFGDRVGTIGLSGLAFNCACPDDGALGAEEMYKWYKANRASRRKDPVRVMLGNQPIDGFVVGLSEDVVDPSLNLTQWGMDIKTLPEDDGRV